jgi:hypothetical protein
MLTDQLTLEFGLKEKTMSDGLDGSMINKTKPYNKSTGIQGIGDTIKAMNEWNMNDLNDPIVDPVAPGSVKPGKFNKNS